MTHAEVPISYSASEIANGECGPGLFLPLASAKTVLGKPVPSDWGVIARQPGSVSAGSDTVQISIQGESKRTITLTGISFSVTRLTRPNGVTFGGQCGGPTVGRTIVVSLDATPPQIVDSSRDPKGILGEVQDGQSITRPIRFPWTVSVTDPLLLDIIATSRSCYCAWHAEIPWVSGGQHGTLLVDNDAKQYKVAGEAGLRGYIPNFGRWRDVGVPSYG